MVPASLSKLAFWSRARRWRRYAYDPAHAPHRPLVTSLVTAHLPALTLRLRKDHVEELITRILLIETSAIPLVEEPTPRQLVLLIARAQQAIEQLENEQAILRRRFSRLSETFSRTANPEQQRALIEQYLINTVTDPHALKGDLQATRRFLGFDVLRERNATELAHLSINIETGLQFIGLAGGACLGSGDAQHRPTLHALLNQTRSDHFLGERLEHADRWQVRLAAGDALLCIYQAGLGDAVSIAWDDATGERAADPAPHAADERRMSRERRQRVLAIIERCARNLEEHAWVQAKALELLLVLDTDRATELLNDRLLGDKPEEARTDFLFRRLAVGLAGRYLRVLGATSLFLRMIERPDPSEHVRMGVCEALGMLPPTTAIAALMRVIGAEGSPADASARVRATALIALCRVAQSGELDAGGRESVVEAIAFVLETDADSLVLEVTCAELPAVADELGRSDPASSSERWMPRWRAALKKTVCAPATPPRMCDVAAATAEVLDRHRAPDRLALVDFLAARVAAIPPGTRAFIPWSAFPDSSLAAARDPMRLGRCLAELSCEDWGLCARARRRGLVLWRGDLFEFRMWRLLHEARNPAPNKRQGHVHTWGRTPRGDLRAPSSCLDEVTATTVPGERTHVAEAGGWGRYLPLVDDLLDLPVLRRRPVHIFSSHGVTTIDPPRSLWRRLRNRLWLTWRYPVMASLRQSALAATEPAERHRFVKTVAEKLRVKITFEPHGDESDDESGAPAGEPTSQRILTLFRGKDALEPALAPKPAPAAAGAVATVPFMDGVGDWLAQNGPYFLSLAENSQTALALFLTVFLSWYLVWSHMRRRRLARAREGIPLSIGGWGTRGKSGTERLKGGMFHGLGYHVLAKTTGCEAMFINAQPGQEATEIFLYRPYDKATIWEQADVLALAQGVSADVFLWECMALNPRYVGILQHEWMQDDMTTLTNAYPDHEDVQGPAGHDVARVIATFIPRRSVVVTSETNFLPLFRQMARDRDTAFHPVPSYQGDLIAGDVLDLFPYSEHPRNIALVGRMAELLGIDRDLAIITMAENVVPDLGVLKSYGPATVRGRQCTFINGCSANERTGFLNNWQRTGLDQLDADRDPAAMIITVVNNRADRIARSKVFADILVRDTAVDRHVLIGTNLKGLRSYLNTALEQYLADKRLVQPADLDEPDPAALPMSRLEREMKRFRIPRPTRKAALDRFALYASGAGLAVTEPALAALGERVDRLLAPAGDEAFLLEEVIRGLEADRDLTGLLERLLAEAGPASDPDVLETLEPPSHADVIEHFIENLARILVRARLEARLHQVIHAGANIDRYHDDFKAAFRAMFEKCLVIVHDPMTTGDRIIEICAQSVPPGTRLALLGTQNIKGTGLDFVYRWIAIDRVITFLDQVRSARAEQRMAGLSGLEGYEDFGLFGAGLARATLTGSGLPALSAQEESLRQRVVLKVEAIMKARRAAMQSVGGASRAARVMGWIESALDYLDSINRKRKSRRLMNDLIHQRVSLGRAAIEMRDIVGRQKGGWLLKALRREA